MKSADFYVSEDDEMRKYFWMQIDFYNFLKVENNLKIKLKTKLKSNIKTNLKIKFLKEIKYKN